MRFIPKLHHFLLKYHFYPKQRESDPETKQTIKFHFLFKVSNSVQENERQMSHRVVNFTTFVFKFCIFFPNKSISFIEDKIWRFYVTSGNLPSCCAILKGGGRGGAVKFESRGSYFDPVIFVALLFCRLFSQKLSEQRNITVRRLRMYLNSNTTQLTRTSEKLAPKC